jgi:hypothetical protein
MNNNLQQKNSTPCAASTKTVRLALHQQKPYALRRLHQQTNKRTNKLTKRTKI